MALNRLASQSDSVTGFGFSFAVCRTFRETLLRQDVQRLGVGEDGAHEKRVGVGVDFVRRGSLRFLFAFRSSRARERERNARRTRGRVHRGDARDDGLAEREPVRGVERDAGETRLEPGGGAQAGQATEEAHEHAPGRDAGDVPRVRRAHRDVGDRLRQRFSRREGHEGLFPGQNRASTLTGLPGLENHHRSDLVPAFERSHERGARLGVVRDVRGGDRAV